MYIGCEINHLKLFVKIFQSIYSYLTLENDIGLELIFLTKGESKKKFYAYIR